VMVVCGLSSSAGKLKIMVSDLEKLLIHRAMLPTCDRYDDSVCDVSTVAIIT